MITFVRTASIMPGKLIDAMKWAKEVAALVQKKTGKQLGVSMPIGGNPNRIAWVAMVETLADYEQMMQKITAEPEYHAMLAAAAPMVVPGSAYDEMWRSI